MASTCKPILIYGGQLHTGEETIENGYIKVINQSIVELGEMKQLSTTEGYTAIKVPSSYKVIPGFIDIHIHGTNGADTMDATITSLDKLASSLPSEGTTSFLATTITQESKAIERALLNVSEYIDSHQRQGKAEILGVHLEGPFINPNKAGAQPISYICEPDLEQFKKWKIVSGNKIRLVTLAPELAGGLEMVRFLKENNITVSVGHSNATYKEMKSAIHSGVTSVTHLYNQMSELHHREPGVIGAAFLHSELMAEIIVDGNHVGEEMVKLAFQQMGKERLILITDSMRAKSLEDGQYDLGGQVVFVKDGRASLPDRTLAGSVLRFADAVKNIQLFTGCTLDDAIVMASANPAKLLNIYDKKGSLTVGKDADIVILNDRLDVEMTFCKGKLSFDAKVRKDSIDENYRSK